MRPRLILLNGPPAVGKSTIARRYAADHPRTLRLDVDELREEIPDWRDDPDRSGRRARAMAAERTRAHLRDGQDVVIAQLFGRTEPLLELEVLAADCGADLREVVLVADLDDTLAHFVERGGPRLADVMASPAGLDTVRDLHGRIEAILVERPRAVLVEPVWGDADATYAAVLAAIDGPRP